MMVRERSIWLASVMAAVLTAGAAQAQTSSGAGGMALLRINCEGESIGADVTLNDEFKGACPIDVSVPAGTVRLRAVKPQGELRESVLEQEFRIGSGVVKKIELEMPASQLNARGQKLEEARIKEDEARKLQAAEEQRRLAEAKALEDTRKAAAAAEQLAQVPIQLAKNVDAMLKARRVARGTESQSCPDCVAEFVGSDGVKADFPTTTDKAFKLLLERPKANALRYLATNGAEFHPPATAAPLPCDSAVDTMRKLTPLLNYSELSPREQAGKDRAHPKEPRQYIRDAKLWPVVATCVNGLLDGPLEFWMFGNQVWGDRDAGGPMLRVMASLVRVQATMSAGAPVGPIAISRRNGGEMAARYEPATGRFLRQDLVGQGVESVAFSSQYARETENPTSYEIIVSRNEKVDARGDEEWNPRSYYRRPFSGEIIEVDSYRAGSHLRHYFAKGGLFHGEYTTFAHIYMGYVNGKTVKCYRDGVEIEMKPCIVN